MGYKSTFLVLLALLQIGFLASCKTQRSGYKLNLVDSLSLTGRIKNYDDFRYAKISVRDGFFCTYHPSVGALPGPYIFFHDINGHELFYWKNGDKFKGHRKKPWCSLTFANGKNLYMLDYSNHVIWSININDGLKVTKNKYLFPLESQKTFEQVPVGFSKWPGMMSSFPYYYNDGLIMHVVSYFEDEYNSVNVHDFMGSQFVWLSFDKSAPPKNISAKIDYEKYYSENKNYTNSSNVFFTLVEDKVYYVNALVPELYRHDLKTNSYQSITSFKDVLQTDKNIGDNIKLDCEDGDLSELKRKTEVEITGLAHVPQIGIALIVVDRSTANERRVSLMVFDYEGSEIYVDDDFQYYRLVDGHSNPGEVWCHFPVSGSTDQPEIFKYKLLK